MACLIMACLIHHSSDGTMIKITSLHHTPYRRARSSAMHIVASQQPPRPEGPDQPFTPREPRQPLAPNTPEEPARRNAPFRPTEPFVPDEGIGNNDPEIPERDEE